MKALVDKVVAYVKDLYAREPARVNAAVLAVLAAVGVPIAVAGVPVATIVAAVLALLFTGEITRSAVFSPATVKVELAAAKRKK